MLNTTPTKKAKIGIIHAGHPRYWDQFKGSRQQTIDGAMRFKSMVEKNPVDVVITDLIDTTDLSFAAGRMLHDEGIDFLFIYLHSYVASGYWLPGIKHLNVPMALVTTPKHYDMEAEYITGTAVRFGSPCQMPEAYSAMVRCGITPCDYIFGEPDMDPQVQREIDEWCAVANALAAYRDCNIGYMGHSYNGMLDMNFDPTGVTAGFGIYCKMLEMCELAEYVEGASAGEVKSKLDEMHQIFDFAGKSGDPITNPATPEQIDWAGRCAVGLEKLVTNNNLAGLAYYYEGLNNLYERIGANLIVGNTMLTSRGIALAGEGDMKTCIAMKTTGALGFGGSFAEFGIVDFNRQEVYVGHDGPHDLRITDGRPCIRGLTLYHGKRGTGISVEFSIKKGDMTMVSLASDYNGRYKWVVAEGQSMPGRLPQIANTVTRGYFGGNVTAFLKDWSMRGVCHHQSLCVGHIASVMEKLGRALGMPVEVVSRNVKNPGDLSK